MAVGARASGLRKRKRRAPATSGPVVQKRPRWTLGPMRSLSVGRMYALPRTLRTTMRYYEYSAALNPGAGGVADQYVFSANGLYDPNITGVGHQPAGFDQLMSFYDHFTVVSSKITVDFQNTDSSNEAIVFLAVRDASTAIGSNLTGNVENGACDIQFLTARGNSRSTARMTMPCNVGSYLGRKTVLDDPELKGNASANPSEQVYFLLGAWPNSSTDSGIVGFHCIIDYDVIFHERKPIASS